MKERLAEDCWVERKVGEDCWVEKNRVTLG